MATPGPPWLHPRALSGNLTGVEGGNSNVSKASAASLVNPLLSLIHQGQGQGEEREDLLRTSWREPWNGSENLNLNLNFGAVGEGVTDDDWSVEDAFVEGSHLWWLLVAGYCFVFTVGVIGNAVLLAALCGSGSRARALPVRNHLMVNLAAADLLVTAVCVPISACAAASHACWPSLLVSWMCELGPLLQRTPVAASTLSLALLSLDRWAALRHPRFAQRFRDKRFVLMSMGVIWIVASLVSAPTFWAREWDSSTGSRWPSSVNFHPHVLHSPHGNSHYNYNYNNNFLNTSTQHQHQLHPDGSKSNLSSQNWSWPVPDSGVNTSWTDASPSSFSSSSSSSSTTTSWQSWGWTGRCTEHWTNAGIQLAYAATYLGTAFVSPALIVAACHASVSQKLTAQLQVLSGAGGGGADKTRQRPKQVIIVARELTTHNHNNPVGNGNGSRKPSDPNLLSVRGNGHGPPNSGDGLLHPPPINDHPSPNNCKMSRKVIPCDPNSDDDDVYLRMQIQADLESFRQLSQLQQNHHNQGNKGGGGSKGRSSLLPSFRSMRKSLRGKRGSGGGGGEGEDEENRGQRAEVESSSDKSCVNALDALNVVCQSHPLKAARRETSIIRAHRRLRKKLSNPLRPPPPLLPTYSSQSFRSRRRAANLLAALAAVFVLCWAPYVVCALWDLFAKDKSIVRLLIPFALFLGHAHSAINPVVSWRLNRSAFVRFQRQPFRSLLPDWSLLSWCRSCTCPCCPCCCCCCCPCVGCGCCDCDPALSPSTPRRPHVKYPPSHRPVVTSPSNQTWGRRGVAASAGRSTGHGCCSANPCPVFNRQFRRSSSPEGWNRNSSTNEAALGAFHPKYLSRLPAPDPISKCHTSHFLR